MQTDKLLTIIIPTYNADATLECALQTVFSNFGKEVELIVVDGNSTDATKDILKKYKDKIEKVISEKDGGIYDAMNKGVALATGKYIYFLGADDELLTSFENLKSYLTYDNKILYGNVIKSPQNLIYDYEFDLKKILKHNICHQSIFYPSSVFKEFKFSTKYKLMADYKLNLEIWASKNYQFKYIDLIVAKYNTNGLSGTVKDNRFRFSSFFIISKLFGLKGIYFKFSNFFKK